MPFNVSWAQWEWNLDEVEGAVGQREPGERELLCFDLGLEMSPQILQELLPALELVSPWGLFQLE